MTLGNRNEEKPEGMETHFPKSNQGIPLETIIKEAKQYTKEPKTMTQRWVEIIRGNKLYYNGINLEYITTVIINGEVEVVIEEKDIQSELKF